MRVGIIGGGTVGHATARAWMEFAEVRVYDVIPERSTHRLDEIVKCDFIFVCLPGDKVGNFIRYDMDRGLPPTFIKSTVPWGTTRRLFDFGIRNVVHHPEFLTERCAVADACNPAQLVFGFPGLWPGIADMVNVIRKRFPGAKTVLCNSDDSELAKLALNSFFAVKVAFFNELKKMPMENWENFRDIIIGDGRVTANHTQVPGPDGKYGFGGKCLPKDLQELVNLLGPEAVITKAALVRNERDRNANHQ